MQVGSAGTADWVWKSYWHMWGVTGGPRDGWQPLQALVVLGVAPQKHSEGETWSALISIYFSSNQEQNSWDGCCHRDITPAVCRIIFGMLTYYTSLIHIWYNSNIKLTCIWEKMHRPLQETLHHLDLFLVPWDLKGFELCSPGADWRSL